LRHSLPAARTTSRCSRSNQSSSHRSASRSRCPRSRWRSPRFGGLFDAAKYWEIEKSSEDFGQTLGVWGAGPGPYLILPFLPPLTVRDGIGKAVDGAMDPLSYVLPLIWTRLGMEAGDTLNDRSLNLDLFQGFEESVVDMYSAVRHGYLRRREQVIKE